MFRRQKVLIRCPRGRELVEKNVRAFWHSRGRTVSVRLRGRRVTAKPIPDNPRDFALPVFRGTLTDRGNAVELDGTIRPSMLVWFATVYPIVMLALSWVSWSSNAAGSTHSVSIATVVIAVLVFWGFMLIDRRREKERRAELLAALRQATGGHVMEPSTST